MNEIFDGLVHPALPVSYMVNTVLVEQDGQRVDVDVFATTVDELSGMGFRKAIDYLTTNDDVPERREFVRRVAHDLLRGNLTGQVLPGLGMKKGKGYAADCRKMWGLTGTYKYGDSDKLDDAGYFELYPYMGNTGGVLSIAVMDVENDWKAKEVAWIAALISTFPTLGSFTSKVVLVKPNKKIRLLGNALVKGKKSNGFASGLLTSKLKSLAKK